MAVDIVCSLPFPLYAEGEYQVAFNFGTVTVNSRRIRQAHIDPRIGIAAGNFELTADRRGMASNTELTIAMGWAMFDRLCDQFDRSNKTSMLQGVAGVVVNRFIESYRHASRIEWVKKIDPRELFTLDVQTIYANGMVEGEHIQAFGQGGITLPIVGLGDEKQSAFQRSLESGANPPIWEEFQLDAQDAFNRRDLRSAVIWGHSAVEVLALEIVLASVRNSDMSVTQAASLLGKSGDWRRTLNRCLSLEEVVQAVDDIRKVEFVLFEASEIDESRVYELCTRYERLAADRNNVLHSGGRLSLGAARSHIDTVEEILRGLSSKSNLEAIQTSIPRSAIKVLEDLIDRPPLPQLTSLIKEAEEAGMETTIWSMPSYPIKRIGHSDGVAVHLIGQTDLRIYVPPRRRLANADWELELTRLFTRIAVEREGWPITVVADSTPGHQNLEAYGLVAEIISDTVLGWVVDRRLQEAGIDVNERADKIARGIERYLKAAEFVEPSWGEMNYYQIPLQVVMTQYPNPANAERLIRLLERKAPRIAKIAQEMMGRVERIGWQSSASCATLMLLLKGNLMILDTLGVKEHPDGAIRTRLREDELILLEM